MSSTWKIAKVALITGVTIGAVGFFAGTDNTVNMVHTGVTGTFWGIGVAGGAAKDAGPAFQAGFHASDGGKATYPTLAPQPNPSPTPKPKAKAKPTPKVPNCTPKQKKAAPASCA